MISLGVDIGGTGCKCVAFRDEGTQLTYSYSEYPIASGGVNLSPNILQESVFSVIASCAAKLGDLSSDIAALTVSSFGESFVALNREGNPLGDIMLYFGNAESEEFFRLVEKVGEEQFMRIARIMPDASYSLAKMLYIRDRSCEPVWKYLFIAGFITFRLCGRALSDVSLACRSLIYDVNNLCWSEELCRECEIDLDTLPEVVPTGEIAGNVLPHIAHQLGLPVDTKIVVGAHDQIVNALGAGVSEAGEAVDSSGTSECITPLFPDLPESLNFQKCNFACVPYLDTGGYVTYAYNISAGSVVRWCRDALAIHLKTEAAQQNISVYDILNESCPSDPTELIVLPFLQGMGGTPDVDAGATGLIAGLTTQTRLPDIYRAILEGITFEMKYNQEKLLDNGVILRRLYACGGGAASKVWLQIKADMLDCEIIPVKAAETGAMGSAILGFSAVTGRSVFDIAKDFISYGKPVKPNIIHREIYASRYETYKAMRKIYTSHRKSL
ncbi:MAG: hypothetical protein GX633_10495 [Clostridiales bacterium]|jgi:xylulokinase|nr:hypothetical protein [Clostridiales bacterium]